MIPQISTPWLMITGGDLILPGGEVLYDGTLLINQGIIHDITEKAPASMLLGQEDVEIIDATGLWVSPGLIDQHLHGAFGVDFNQSSVADIHQLLAQLPHYGITGILPTLITAPKLDMAVGLANMEEVILNLQPDQARIFGIHLEGPFLNPQFKGAHPAEDLLPATLEQLEGLLSPNLKRMTLAPELDKDFLMIKTLINQNILCSMGHSGADYNTAMQAVSLGVNCATHLFNAMKGLMHRDPSMLVTALIHPDVFVELIADGLHVSPPVLQLVLQTKPPEKTILISDCNALTGMPTGTSHKFGRQTITIHPEGPLNQDGKLAGSTSLITDCLRNIVKWNLLTFPDAIQLATYNPALHLRETPLFGQLTPGAMADLVLWNQADLSIHSVFLAGHAIATPTADPTEVHGY